MRHFQQRNIVILGGGFGGIMAAKILAKEFQKKKELQENYDLFLIDRNNYLTFTPALYEIVTTEPEIAGAFYIKKTACLSFADIFNKKDIRFLQDEVQVIDTEKRKIFLAEKKELSFEYLILALGSEPNFFAIPGLEKFALPLKSVNDGIKIRNRIFESFLNAAKEKTILRIVIGGAGATGVEIAGETRGYIENLKKRTTEAPEFEIVLIEAAPRVLPMFEEWVSKAAKRRLLKFGIKILTNHVIKKINDKEIVFDGGGTLKYSVFAWTGGIKPAKVLDNAPLDKDKKGRIVSASTLQALKNQKICPRIFIVGDICCFSDADLQAHIVGNAPSAMEMGKTAAENILRKIEGRKLKNHNPPPHIFAIPIKGKWAIADLGIPEIQGFLGWFLKQLAELRFFIKILPFKKAFLLWLKHINIFTKND